MSYVSLPSRAFSSSTLMDGEDVVRSQNLMDWSVAELEAHLASLEESLRVRVDVICTRMRA